MTKDEETVLRMEEERDQHIQQEDDSSYTVTKRQEERINISVRKTLNSIKRGLTNKV